MIDRGEEYLCNRPPYICTYISVDGICIYMGYMGYINSMGYIYICLSVDGIYFVMKSLYILGFVIVLKSPRIYIYIYGIYPGICRWDISRDGIPISWDIPA